MHAAVATLLVARLSGAGVSDTKTQQGSVAVCSTSGTACVDMGGGVRYAEVVP